jgi:dTDP-glucose 4,6-dehydratase
MRTLLVTGGCGFIGSNFIRLALDQLPDYEIINLDALTYAADPANLSDLEDHPRYFLVKGDVSNSWLVNDIFVNPIHSIIHFAAESHVDRSIQNSTPFVQTNVLGTQVLLEAARKHQVARFISVSSDEVYSSLSSDKSKLFTEQTPIAPNNPYSASKAAADLLVRAYVKTYNLPAIITRSSNNYGPRQNTEKFIPMIITRAMRDEPIPIYGSGMNVRDWIYVDDHCRALLSILRDGRVGEVYNVGARNERYNFEVAETILDILGKPRSLITYVEDRLGHDLRYGVDSTKLETELNWSPKYTWHTGLAQTIKWYQRNFESAKS